MSKKNKSGVPINDEQVQKSIQNLFDCLDQDHEKLYLANKEKVDKMDLGCHLSPENFYYEKVYKSELLLEAALSVKIHSNTDVVFIYRNYPFIERLFLHLIEKKEGSPCSADKSRSIINALVEHFKTGKDIVWNYKQKYTYHLPSKIFTTHENIIQFYEAIKSLYWGNITSFLAAMPIVLMSAKPAPNQEQ